MQHDFTPTSLDAAYTPPTPAERALAPNADETRTTTKPLTANPTKRRRSSAHFNACDRDDYLREKAANGDHMARTLLGWL